MKRLLNLLLIVTVTSTITCIRLQAQTQAQPSIVLPGEEGRKAAITLDYFPHPQYAFVWRNWSVVDKNRIDFGQEC